MRYVFIDLVRSTDAFIYHAYYDLRSLGYGGSELARSRSKSYRDSLGGADFRRSRCKFTSRKLAARRRHRQ